MTESQIPNQFPNAASKYPSEALKRLNTIAMSILLYAPHTRPTWRDPGTKLIHEFHELMRKLLGVRKEDARALSQDAEALEKQCPGIISQIIFEGKTILDLAENPRCAHPECHTFFEPLRQKLHTLNAKRSSAPNSEF